jgi:hypothetical protein
MERNIFGKGIYVIGGREWQKRGLTHIHWNVKIHPSKFKSQLNGVDDIICAEIPEEPPADDKSEKAV